MDPIAPGIAEVEPPTREDLRASLGECGSDRLSIVHHEAEMTIPVRRLTAALGEGDELLPNVDEGHPLHPSPQLDLEDRAVEGQRLLHVPDLEGDVVEADQPDALAQLGTVT